MLVYVEITWSYVAYMLTLDIGLVYYTLIHCMFVGMLRRDNVTGYNWFG